MRWEWYIGTMGFSYADWKGSFYPSELATRNYLKYYGEIFNSVEIDSTFYGNPRLSVIKRWMSSTPSRFKFCLKVPRLITHELALVGAERWLLEFTERVKILDDKLGLLLFQFPPSFDAGNFPTLQSFLEILPSEIKFAVEFRHRSWYTSETSELLKSYGIVWASTEYVGLPKEVHLTSDTLYIRFIGKHLRFRRHDHEQINAEPQLGWWKEQIERPNQPIKSIYGFFNNDYAGHSPATANRFMSLMGLPIKELKRPKQGRLF